MHKVIDQKEYYELLRYYIPRARYRIRILSTFAHPKQLLSLKDVVCEAIARGVPVDIFLQKSWSYDRDELAPIDDIPLEALIDDKPPLPVLVRELESWNAHVILIPETHVKLTTIDIDLLIDGTMNVMSHYKNEERLNWWIDEERVRKAIKKHRLICRICDAPFALFELSDTSIDARARFIGEVIRGYRKLRNLPQVGLSLKCKLAQRTISEIESGASNPTLFSVLKLCTSLNLVLVPIPWWAVTRVLRFIGIKGVGGQPDGRLPEGWLPTPPRPSAAAIPPPIPAAPPSPSAAPLPPASSQSNQQTHP